MSALGDAQTYAAETVKLQVEANTSRNARDYAIRCAARDEHATIAELSRATGLTRTMLYKIINKEDA